MGLAPAEGACFAPVRGKMVTRGLPVKILYLGHRGGSTVMVRKDLPAHSLRDLRGKTFAIPSKYSNQNLVIHKLMEEQGVKPDDIRFVELPPPAMPGALAAKAIDAYFVGEPCPARADSMAVGECCNTPRISGLTSFPVCWSFTKG